MGGNTNATFSLNQTYSYGGYWRAIDAQQFILGASFIPIGTECLLEDHVHNYELIHSVFPKYAQSLPDVTTWQGAVHLFAQSLDIFQSLGKMSERLEIIAFC